MCCIHFWILLALFPLACYPRECSLYYGIYWPVIFQILITSFLVQPYSGRFLPWIMSFYLFKWGKFWGFLVNFFVSSRTLARRSCVSVFLCFPFPLISVIPLVFSKALSSHFISSYFCVEVVVGIFEPEFRCSAERLVSGSYTRMFCSFYFSYTCILCILKVILLHFWVIYLLGIILSLFFRCRSFLCTYLFFHDILMLIGTPRVCRRWIGYIRRYFGCVLVEALRCLCYGKERYGSGVLISAGSSTVISWSPPAKPSSNTSSLYRFCVHLFHSLQITIHNGFRRDHHRHLVLVWPVLICEKIHSHVRQACKLISNEANR